MTSHRLRVRGWRAWRVTATCACGWVSECHRSRGEAIDAYTAHRWHADHRRVRAVYGVNAHRIGLGGPHGDQ